jgi:hypothetical protein
MALAKQFQRHLDEMWRRRTGSLRSLVIPRGVGKPPNFTRRVRQKLVNELLDIASEILVKRDGSAEFKDITRERRLMYIKGHGLLRRGRALVTWAQSRLKGPIVYVFWRRTHCLYVGKGGSWKRLRHYERSAYILQATCIEVFCVSNRSQLGKAECLATHLYVPRDKKVKPARVKWGKACPICRKHDSVRDELRGLFRLR